ncbi:restriction endonuclease subunit S [Parafilimonas terrae]|uniref:Type I restriction enzyme, S subunit n=1 Tax=Parafilimonas terrae TaxID=1465490 RepID=A0A1I5W751_9BACT|nr:restriction endonuclease subunit S [Parafilimonas terrae]SFQ15582.1 type I restriction enzyme, S subunit [Parafilimonas terrae]
MKWEKVEIGKVAKVISGFAFKSKDFQPIGTPIIKIKSIKDENIVLDENDCVDSAIEVPTRFHLSKGDILISLTGSHITLPSSVVGRVARYRHETNSYLNQRAGKFINIDNERCSKDYLFYFLLQKETLTKIANKAQGAANQANISPTDVEGVEIKLPPLPMQRKIASILSAYDDLIENNLKRIKLLEEKAFLRYKLIVQNEKLEEFTIEELANVVMGQSPTSDTYTNEKDDNLPFHQGVSNFSNYFVEHKIYCNAPIKIAEEGDILFSVRAPVGRINFTSDKICIGRGLCAFRSKNGFQNYFYHQLKEFFFAEDVIGNGAIFNAVTKVELMKVKLKTPSKKIQKAFEIEAQQMYNLILNLTKQNTKLREARDILLPKLMNGQIEV